MNLFKWSNIIETIIDLFVGAETLEEYQYLKALSLYIGLGVGAFLWLALLILGGIGLVRMAKKEHKKHRWLAFIPFANTAYTGYIAGEARFFGQKMKRAGLYAAIVEVLYCAGYLFNLITEYLLIPYYREFQQSYPNSDVTYTLVAPDPELVPANLKWLYEANYGLGGMGWTEMFLILIYFVLLVLLCVMFMALFKKYKPTSAVWMTLISVIFPVSDILIFVFSKNTPVDYDAWARRRHEEYIRRQQSYYGGNPYGGQPYSDFSGRQNPEGQGRSDSSDPPPKDDNPFSDF